MTYSKFDPGCGCCESGCDILRWVPPEGVNEFSLKLDDFSFIGDTVADDVFGRPRIKPGSILLSNDPLISSSSWIYQQMVRMKYDKGYAVRWIAHATPTEYISDPLGDHIFADIRRVPATSTAQMSLGMVVGGVETIFSTSLVVGNAFGALSFGNPYYGKFELVDHPSEGKFERLINPSGSEFNQADDGPIVTTYKLGYLDNTSTASILVGTDRIVDDSATILHQNWQIFSDLRGGRDIPASGQFYTFTSPCRVYEQLDSTVIDPAIAPFLEIGTGQVLRRWGATDAENLKLENCTVVDLSSITHVKVLSFNGRLSTTHADRETGIVVSGASIPETLPSGGHIGIQVIDTGDWSEDDLPNLERAKEVFASKARSHFNPTCPELNIHTMSPCAGGVRLLAQISTTIVLKEVIKEVSGNTTDPDYNLGSESPTINFDGQKATRTVGAIWGEAFEEWKAEEYVEVRPQTHPYRADQFRVPIKMYIIVTDPAGIKYLYAHAAGSVGNLDLTAFEANINRDFMILGLHSFNCAMFSIDLEYELGPGAVDGSAIVGKKWTLASL